MIFEDIANVMNARPVKEIMRKTGLTKNRVYSKKWAVVKNACITGDHYLYCFDERTPSYFNYKVDDIDKRQAVGGVMEALNKEATYGLADEMDKHIAGMAATREAVTYAASATAITKDNVLGEIDKALEKLYGNNVRPNGKIMMEVPPWFYMRLKQAYTALDTDNSKMLENGRVGKYGNVIVKMSNNVAVDSSANSLITVHTDKAVAFVNPMTHVEAYRPEKGFSDAVKGFVLYQAKIVRPKELVVLNCKAGA